MRSSTSYNHQKRILAKIRDIYGSAKIFKWSLTKFIEAKKKIYEDPAWQRVPEHVRSYINGYDSAKWENHQQNVVTWVLPFNGVNYNKWDDLPEEGKEAYRKNEAHGIHVYRSDMTSIWN